MNTTDIISLIALILSIGALGFTIYERKVKLNACLSLWGEESVIDLYNLSNRKITISYFELYSSKFKRLTKRNFAYTAASEGEKIRFVIAPYESHSIEFKEQYNISSFISLAAKENKSIYIRILIYGNKWKIKKLK